MHWFVLLLAIVLEVSGTTSMKLAEGFSKLLPSVLVFVFYALSLSALVLALEKIDVSVAYAIWSGLGTSLIVAIAVIHLDEQLTFPRVVSLVLVVVGVIGLYLSSSEAA